MIGELSALSHWHCLHDHMCPYICNAMCLCVTTPYTDNHTCVWVCLPYDTHSHLEMTHREDINNSGTLRQWVQHWQLCFFSPVQLCPHSFWSHPVGLWVWSGACGDLTCLAEILDKAHWFQSTQPVWSLQVFTNLLHNHRVCKMTINHLIKSPKHYITWFINRGIEAPH